jgi:two-component system chemotaxis response regulator CheY
MTISDRSLIRVLLLEDEAFIRETIRVMLRGFSNVEVREGVDGTEGLRLMEEGFSPDVVLCDVHMEPMDGLAFLRQLRASRDPARTTLHVIMLTAASDPETVRAAVTLGVSSYLVKPVSLKRLEERLSAALQGGSGHMVPNTAAPKVMRRRSK